MAEVFKALGEKDPRQIAGYRLAAKLGSGGMGKVYLSYTPAGRPVAIKVVRPDLSEDPEFRSRFRREVAAAKRVHGLYTAPVIDAETEGDTPWLATAYVPGPSLQSVVADHGPLPVPTVLLLIAGMAEALAAVHEAGIVHRDFKPSNVLLAADGPRVIDFGISRAVDSSSLLTSSGMTIGTPAFMAPEQAEATDITVATDIFALGQVACFAATGAPAFGDGTPHGVLYRVVHKEPDLSGVPEELREIISHCLAKEAADRPDPAQIIAMCRAAAPGAELRRSDDWLPRAVAADLTDRTAGPAPSGASPHEETVVRDRAAAPADRPAPAPATDSGQHRAPAPTGGFGPPPSDLDTPPATPPPGPAGPPSGPLAPYATDPRQPAAASSPITTGTSEAAGPSDLTGAPGTTGSGTGATGTGGGAGRGGRRRTAALVAAAVLVIGAGVAVAYQVSKDDGGSNSAQHEGDRKTPGGPHDKPSGGSDGSDGADGADGADGSDGSDGADGSGDPTGSGDGDAPGPGEDGQGAEPTGVPSGPIDRGPGALSPKGVDYDDISLPDGYHLTLASDRLRPDDSADTADDLRYANPGAPGSGGGSVRSGDGGKLVLLRADEYGSATSCRDTTRFTSEIGLGQLAAGSRFCVLAASGDVALVTYRGAAPQGDPSDYISLDVTVWRAAEPR
ncbi:serine/threonine-protein kinase [Streptomyces sp. 796.1]|uniref:serine/threonine-protein kinase n=1 Tax=Streptomyces sp. 796.1 TaxID=3163029 RepID=UPI0039C9C099